MMSLPDFHSKDKISFAANLKLSSFCPSADVNLVSNDVVGSTKVNGKEPKSCLGRVLSLSYSVFVKKAKLHGIHKHA
jgi:hypothetical protein